MAAHTLALLAAFSSSTRVYIRFIYLFVCLFPSRSLHSYLHVGRAHFASQKCGGSEGRVSVPDLCAIYSNNMCFWRRRFKATVFAQVSARVSQKRPAHWRVPRRTSHRQRAVPLNYRLINVLGGPTIFLYGELDGQQQWRGGQQLSQIYTWRCSGWGGGGVTQRKPKEPDALDKFAEINTAVKTQDKASLIPLLLVHGAWSSLFQPSL